MRKNYEGIIFNSIFLSVFSFIALGVMFKYINDYFGMGLLIGMFLGIITRKQINLLIKQKQNRRV